MYKNIIVGFFALTAFFPLASSVDGRVTSLTLSVDSNASSALVLSAEEPIVEKNESKWDQHRERIGAVVERAKALFASHPANVSEAWKKINAAAQNIHTITRGECAQTFIAYIQSGEVNEALSYLAAAKLNVFDKPANNEQSVFKTLVTELKNTPDKEEEKRALVIFSLATMYMFSLQKIPQSPKSQRNKNVKKKKKKLREANEDLQDIITQENVKRHT